MLPCIFYIVMLILLLYYPAHSLGVTVSIKKKPAVYSRTTDFLYYSFYLLRCVSDKFSIFKHNLLPSRYPSSLLSAPITFAMDCATEGFSAITNFIFFHSNFVSFFHFYLLFDSANAIMYIE